MNSSATLSACLVGLAALGAPLCHAAAERNRPVADEVPFSRVDAPRYTVLCDACGGAGGVPFNRMRAKHGSGQIVLLARPDSDLWALNEQGRLRQNLERAGFAVRVVESQRDLEAVLSDKPADIVLADGADVAALRDLLATAAAAPVVLSVAPLRDSAATPLESNCRVQVSTKQAGDFVKVIASYVTRRQAGTAIDCGPSTKPS
jgi:hypothetical protein